MKYFTINLKKKYKTNKTSKNKNRSFFQSGGETGQQDITSIIKSSDKDNIHIIGPSDTLYPEQFIGYHVFVPSNQTPFTIDQLLKTDENEGVFVKNGKIDVSALDKQVYLDINRSTILVNNQYIYNTFKDKLEQDKEFITELTKTREQTNEKLFSKDLQNIFKKLNVDEDEHKAIYELSQENTNSTTVPEFWGIIPYFDEILNINGIVKMDELNRIKLFCQQNISKTLLDLLMKFVSFTNTISHNSFFIGGMSKFQQQNLFGNKSNNYIQQIPAGLNIHITINSNTKQNQVILEQNLYQCLININNEFGLAIINTSVYVDIIQNKLFFMWKIDRWRNGVIKNYYKFIVDMNDQKWTIPESTLILLNSNMCNNLITDDFPKSQQALLEYFMAVFKYYIPAIKMKGGSDDNNSKTTNETITDSEEEDKEQGIYEVKEDEVVEEPVKEVVEEIKEEPEKEVVEEPEKEEEEKEEIEKEVVEEPVKEEPEKEEIEKENKVAEEPVKSNYTTEQIESINSALNAINNMIESNFKTTSDTKLKKMIQSETNKYLTIKKRILNLFKKSDANENKDENNDNDKVLDSDNTDTQEIKSREESKEETYEQQLQEQEQEEKIHEQQIEQQDEDRLKQDYNDINSARNNLQDAHQQYSDDLNQLREDQPPTPVDEQLTNKLATVGSVAALGAIGTGLYFAAPLLLGGSGDSKKRKKRLRFTKTIKNL
jgi:hypothetical protein